jgi:hypothetical protein
MRGFKEHEAADRFCREHDELRNFLRSRSRHNQYIPCSPATPSLSPQRTHRDRRHADCMIRKFTARATPQTARGMTKPSISTSSRVELACQPCKMGRQTIGDRWDMGRPPSAGTPAGPTARTSQRPRIKNDGRSSADRQAKGAGPANG